MEGIVPSFLVFVFLLMGQICLAGNTFYYEELEVMEYPPQLAAMMASMGKSAKIKNLIHFFP